VRVDEFRIGVAETYDCIVTPQAAQAYTIFAQSEDRTGYARGTLAPRTGMSAAIPPMDPRPVRTMLDMGMGSDAKMGSMDMNHRAQADTPPLNVENQNVAAMPVNRLADPGDGPARQWPPCPDLCRPARDPSGQRCTPALTRDHPAPDRQHGALYLGV
jgi:FtsP/CotA-like multicopper oxidase with cupredoxin domain